MEQLKYKLFKVLVYVKCYIYRLCVYMYVCMHVCVCVHVHVCARLCVHVCMYTCMCVRMCVLCVYACTHVYVCVYLCMYMYVIHHCNIKGTMAIVITGITRNHCNYWNYQFPLYLNVQWQTIVGTYVAWTLGEKYTSVYF